MTETTPAKANMQKARVYGPDGSSTVKCDCCGESTFAANFYYGMHKCSKGGPSKEFVALFKVYEATKVEPKKQQAKKKPEAASKASTPVKESAEHDEAPETPKEEKKDKKVAKKDQDGDEKAPKSKKAKSDESSAKSSKAAPASDDAEKIKKPLSGYMLFSNATRQAILAENPELKVTEVAKVLGAKWKEMGDEEKQTWQDQAAKLKAEYLEKTGRSTEKTEKKPQKAESKSDSAPASSKPKSAYLIWSAATREKVKDEHPGIKPKEILSILSDMWKNISAEEKAKYEAEAAQQSTSNIESSKAGAKRKRVSAESGSENEEDVAAAADSNKETTEESEVSAADAKSEEDSTSEAREDGESKEESGAMEEEQEEASATQQEADSA